MLGRDATALEADIHADCVEAVCIRDGQHGAVPTEGVKHSAHDSAGFTDFPGRAPPRHAPPGHAPGKVDVAQAVLDSVPAGLARAPRARRQQQELQLLRQRCLEQGPEQLEPAHKQLLAADAESLRWLHQQVWLSAPHSPWGKRLANRIAN